MELSESENKINPRAVNEPQISINPLDDCEPEKRSKLFPQS